MAILSHPLTYADLELARESRDEHLELIDGEILVTPSPTPFHQFVNQRLYDLFKATVVNPGHGAIGYAPLDVSFDDENVLQPDLLILLAERTMQIGEKSVEGPPSLVVEIASPSTIADDRGRKRRIYARNGVPEYWLVEPTARQATVYSDPANGRYRREQSSTDIVVSATIPGLSIALAELFAPVPGR
jgi:Uma2 family endonuclease